MSERTNVGSDGLSDLKEWSESDAAVLAAKSEKFITFTNPDEVNEHLKSLDLNALAAKYGRREEFGMFRFDSIGLQLFVSRLLRETFYER